MMKFLSELASSIIERLDLKDLVLLVIPLSITGAGFVAKLFWQHGRDYFISRQYRLSGEYLTFYDNPKIGSEGFDRAYAQSSIKQKGASLTIKTVEPHGRTWIHKGYIVKDRFISGWYQAKDPHDTGVGTFFLQIKNKENLVGSWHGHDHEGNRHIATGLYQFRKRRTIGIEQLKPRDIPSVLKIADRAFGPHYVTSDVVIGDGVQVLVGSVDRQIIGFCLFYFMKAGTLQELLHQKSISAEALRYANTAGRIGIIKTIAVDQKYRSFGIGDQLFLAAQKQLTREMADTILVPIWYWQQSGSLQNIAERNGYVFLFEDKEYWKQACEAGTFQCIAKKDEACRCSCRFYFKTPRPELRSENTWLSFDG